MKADYLGFLGFGLVAASFLVRDMLWLRALSIASNAVLIAFNYFAPEKPLWVAIGWCALFIAINVVQIAISIRERKGISFSDEEKELYETVFAAFSPVEFAKLLRIGSWKAAQEGQALVTAGEKSDRLLLLYNGAAAVTRGQKTIAHIRDGAFVGEMEYLSDDPVWATVTVTAPTRYLEWPTGSLKALLVRNPSMAVALQTTFSQDLIQKLQAS